MQDVTLCVTGASGLIGAEVCRLTVAMGHRVIGLSRHGRDNVPEEPWVEGVEWLRADIFDPDSYRDALKGVDALVHCVGLASEDEEEDRTFERVHGDAAILAYRTARHAGVGKFVFLSASDALPLQDRSRVEAKRRAEVIIAAGDMPYVFLRPGLVWGARRPLGRAAARLLDIASASELPGAQTLERYKPLRVERVAMAALRAAIEPDVTGILDPDEIAHLGDAMMIQ